MDATASTAPAKFFSYPVFFINGIVNTPVVATFAMALPEIVPISALETTAIKPGPPRYLPTRLFENSIKNVPAPEASKKDPNSTKRNTYVAEIVIGSPNMPVNVRYICSMNLGSVTPL